MKVMRGVMRHSTVEREAPRLRLVTDTIDTRVVRPPRSPGGIVRSPMAVAVPLRDMGEAEVRGMKVVRRLLRLGVMVGMMATAWQAGLVIGAL